MLDSSIQLEQQTIEEIVREYQARGYQVVVEPAGEHLPDFLRDYRPDIIARSDDETVVIEVKSSAPHARQKELKGLAESIQSHPGWRFSLVVVNPKDEFLPGQQLSLLNESGLRERYREVQALLDRSHPEAALLLAWAATEGVLRLLALKEEVELQRRDTPTLLKQLVSFGLIGRDQYDALQDTFRIRNAVAHGFGAADITPAAQTLIQLGHALLSEQQASITQP